MFWLVAAIVWAALAGFALGLVTSPARRPHPELDSIQWPINPATTADIERRNTE